MANLDFLDIVEDDADIPQFEVSEGDIGNWRAVLDGVYLQNTGLEDGVPEGNNIDVILDDRDGPVGTYDGFAESRYVLGIDIPTHLRSIEEVLAVGSGQVLSRADANTQNTVGNHATTPGTATNSGEEVYLVKLVGSDPFDFTIDRVGFAHIDPDNFKLSYMRSTGAFIDISDVTGATISVTNKQKGTLEVENLDLLPGSTVTFQRGQRYSVEATGGAIYTVRYIDLDLEDGDTALIVFLGYKFGQLDNTGDYQIERRVANARRQQLTLYRPLGNSTTSRIWVRRIYPDVRLVGPASESTGTGQNSLNVRRWNFRAERIRHPQALSDYYIEQKVQAPAA